MNQEAVKKHTLPKCHFHSVFSSLLYFYLLDLPSLAVLVMSCLMQQ